MPAAMQEPPSLHGYMDLKGLLSVAVANPAGVSRVSEAERQFSDTGDLIKLTVPLPSSLLSPFMGQSKVWNVRIFWRVHTSTAVCSQAMKL